MIVEEALAPDASVSRVARVHDLKYQPCIQMDAGASVKPLAACATPALIPVLLHHGDTAAKRCAQEPAIASTETIELHLSKGRVRLTAAVDPNTLRIVLKYLGT